MFGIPEFITKIIRVEQLFLGAGNGQMGTELTATAAELNAVLDLSAVGAVAKFKILPVTVVAAATEQSTGWSLPATAMVLDVFLDITTQEATGGTKTVDIGTDSTDSGDADGYAAGLSVAAAGLVRPTAAITAGGSETYFSGNTRGALLCNYVAGGNTATDHGLYQEFPDGTMGGKEITYTLGSDDFAELVANMVIVYIEIA
jgi:hypothetical protein